MPLVTIGYQGCGHYQENADIRDRIKARALSSARIVLLEIGPNDCVGDLPHRLALLPPIAKRITQRSTSTEDPDLSPA